MRRNFTIKHFDQLPDSACLRQAGLIQIVPFSPATLWRKVKDGSFPAPVKLSERVTAWRVGDIRVWLLSLSKGALTGDQK